MSTQRWDPESAMAEGFQSVLWAGVGVVGCCVVGGAIAAVAVGELKFSPDECFWLALAWVWHWAFAGIMLWGLLAACIPVWGFNALLRGTAPVGRVLNICFSTQLVVSTISLRLMDRWGESADRGVEVAAVLLLVLWFVPMFRWIVRACSFLQLSDCPRNRRR